MISTLNYIGLRFEILRALGDANGPYESICVMNNALIR